MRAKWAATQADGTRAPTLGWGLNKGRGRERAMAGWLKAKPSWQDRQVVAAEKHTGKTVRAWASALKREAAGTGRKQAGIKGVWSSCSRGSRPSCAHGMQRHCAVCAERPRLPAAQKGQHRRWEGEAEQNLKGSAPAQVQGGLDCFEKDVEY